MPPLPDPAQDPDAFNAAALNRLTSLGLRLAERIVETADQELAPAEPTEVPPAYMSHIAEQVEKSFNRVAAGIRGNIELERKLAIKKPNAEAPKPKPGVADYLKNDPAFDDNDLARLGRCWKQTKEEGKSPLQQAKR